MNHSSGAVVLGRRSASKWTLIHPIFAIGQLGAFLISVGYLIAFALGAVHFNAVQLSVLIKIALMIGALVTGSLWEHDVYGYWWFAPAFMIEDVMTMMVFVTHIAYLIIYYSHPASMVPILTTLGVAYGMYVANVAQYIHRTQQAKKEMAALELKDAA